MISLNVQGLRDYTKRRAVFNFMKRHTSSKGIFFMQETLASKHVKIHGQTNLDVEISILYFLMIYQTAEESLLRFERPQSIK